MQGWKTDADVKQAIAQHKHASRAMLAYVVLFICDDSNWGAHRYVLAVVPDKNLGQKAIILIFPF